MSVVARDESNKRLLKNCTRNDITEERVCLLAQHNHWMHWSQNTRERYGSNGQKNARLNKNQEDENLVEVQLKTVIENGGEELQKLLGRMQKFSANVAGSNACYVKRRKELEDLTEQEGIRATWFTLSAVDDHWLNLNKIIHRVREMPVLATESEKPMWRRNLVRENLHVVDACFTDRVNDFV